jgi:hypothetical protein
MPAPTPDVIVEPFGLNAANPANLQLPIPVPSQLPGNPGNASFNDGFPPDTMLPVGSGGIPPRGQDMNGILYMVTAYLQALTGGQFWTYNATWEAANGGYAAGAVVAMANGTGLWLNTVANNTNNPDTTAAATSGWVPLISYGSTQITGLTGGTVTLTAVQAAYPTIFISGTLTSNLTLVFPAWNSQWRIINNTAVNSFTVSVMGGASSFVIRNNSAETGFTDVYCDSVTGIIHFAHNYGVGNFTGHLNDSGGNFANCSVNYVVADNLVTLYTINSGTGTSSGTGMYMTGLPANILPASGQSRIVPVVGFQDNSSSTAIALAGWAQVSNSGTPIIFSLAKTNLVTNDVAANGTSSNGSFTASGSKGLLTNITIPYSLV